MVVIGGTHTALVTGTVSMVVVDGMSPVAGITRGFFGTKPDVFRHCGTGLSRCSIAVSINLCGLIWLLYPEMGSARNSESLNSQKYVIPHGSGSPSLLRPAKG